MILVKFALYVWACSEAHKSPINLQPKPSIGASRRKTAFAIQPCDTQIHKHNRRKASKMTKLLLKK